jgi:nucleoside phosphorylase
LTNNYRNSLNSYGKRLIFCHLSLVTSKINLLSLVTDQLFSSYFLMNIDYIFVPQGQEYQRVKQGFNLAKIKHPTLIAIPLGTNGVNLFLETWLQSANFHNHRVLLMGLGGSLSPQYGIGDLTLYQTCSYLEHDHYAVKSCDQELNLWLQKYLDVKAHLVQGFTSDRLINLASAKQILASQSQSEVVDMEGWTILTALARIKVNLTILRIISDDVAYNIPDLNRAFTSEGKLKPLNLSLSFLADPLAAFRLIKGSLQALKILEKVAFNLVQILHNHPE